jgi:outer membrane lipoprotein SlyB
MDQQPKKGIHPLMAGAAVAVIVASAVGVAAMTGNLPGSKAQEQASTGSTATTPPAKATPAPTPPRQVAAVAKPKCLDCGVISAINVVEVKGEGTGLGAVAGGVAGAVIGNQIGEDSKHRKLVTVAGAAGGAIAGHEIEKHAKTQKRFDTSVRMDDGSTKTLSSDTEPVLKVGQRVRVTPAGIQAL